MMGLGLRLGPRSSTPALLVSALPVTHTSLLISCPQLFVAIVFVMGTIHMAVPRETIRTYSPWRDGHLQNPMRPAPQQQQQQQQQQAVQRPVPEHHVEQRPELLPPPEPGFGSISSPKNPYRNRFLVPLFACNEQETGSQMHVRQLLHLAKALNRTAVLPNWGFGVRSHKPATERWADTSHRSRPSRTAGHTRSTTSTRSSGPTTLASGTCLTRPSSATPSDAHGEDLSRPCASPLWIPHLDADRSSRVQDERSLFQRQPQVHGLAHGRL